MRKSQKQQVIELVKQIEEAHDQIKKYIEQGCAQFAIELLEDCQNGGITIGTQIEETEGEGHSTVRLLEDYCELIYQIHAELADGREINANKVYKLLRQKLIKVENGLRNDVPVRTEVVFLPYKASMWDSLESVWKAADADSNCDAYVIPIPYYDKNPDGSLREMHYEGDQYPDYVPITKYDEFDLEAHRPDMIYIHNPYDDLNYVTSVHPFFFSENLKKFTDKLVYIPYFILDEIKPDNDAAIDGMKHFCTTPGVLHADEVIVQSEDMKQIYIKVLLEATNDYSEAARNYWDNKILGLGSPKIDKVLTTKKEDLKIPQEWLRIIQKPDGSWKKIFFYNTSVGALLQHNEKMLEKMKDVFKVCKENKEEVALLWRPHPLIKATISAMRPQLWKEYEKLVKQYQEEKWGIYDDSSDVDRAVILSDKYYGDMSSVVHLYKACKKPALIQNVWMLSNHNKRINAQIEAGAVVNNKIYFTIPRYNKFYCMDLENGNTECVKDSTGRRTGESDRFNHATILNNNIYFFSDETYEYAILNVETNKIQEGCWKIADSGTTYLGNYNDEIYLIEQKVNQLIVIRKDGTIRTDDIKEVHISSTDGVIWHFEREEFVLWKIDIINKQKEKASFWNEGLLNDNKYSFVFEQCNKLIFVPDLTDEIIVFDLFDKSLHKIKMPECTTGFLGGVGAFRYIEGTNKRYFLSSVFSSEIFLWNNDGLEEIGKAGIGIDVGGFEELYGDLLKNGSFSELYMDLSVYINW